MKGRFVLSVGPKVVFSAAATASLLALSVYLSVVTDQKAECGDFIRYKNDTGYDGICGTSTSDNCTYDWYVELNDVGYTGLTRYNNISRKWLTDPGLETNGEDYLNIEDYDIALLVGHGGVAVYNSVDQYRYRTITRQVDGDGNITCNVYPRETMDIGELSGDDIEIFHLLSCHSMETTNSQHANTWRSVFGGVHQVNGFHGSAWGISSLAVHWGNLGRNGFLDGVGAQWVSALYASNFTYYENEWVDQCPVSYTGRNSQSGAEALLDNEQYDTRDDYLDVNGPSTFVRYYVSGCNPAGAGAQ